MDTKTDFVIEMVGGRFDISNKSGFISVEVNDGEAESVCDP